MAEDAGVSPPKLEAPINVEEEDDDSTFIVLDGEVWRTKKSKPKAPPPKRMEAEEERRAVTEEEEEEAPELEMIGPDDEGHWMTVAQFRRYWNQRWSGYYGSFEDTTRISPMRFTDEPVEGNPRANGMDTLQIYSVKLAAARGGLQLPLDVFGMVAIRDPVDHNRNIIFHRERDDCQTLTEKDPYLVLTGPTRAVMLEFNPVIVEVDLKVKGIIESKDVYLSFLVAPVSYSALFSHLFKRTYSSKLSTMEFAFGQIGSSVEATIFVRIVRGSWPDGLRGQFAAFTTGFTDRCSMPVGNKISTGTGCERIILLDSGAEELPVADDGKIELSRRVVPVEGCGEVIVQVKSFKGEFEIVEITKSFQAAKFGNSTVEIDISFCKMEITVFWSLISHYPLE